MKTIKNSVGLMALLFLSGVAIADVRIGDVRDKVIRELGQPAGSIQSGDYEMLRYPRGKVELKERKVTFVELMSQEAYDTWKTRRAAKQAEKIVAKETTLVEVEPISGEDVKKRILSNPNYMLATAAKQASIWRNFIHQYPDVDVSREYQEALSQLHGEMELRQQKRENELLEQRAKAAEQRAIQAELDLRESRVKEVVTYSSTPTYVYETPVPYVVNGGYYPVGYGGGYLTGTSVHYSSSPHYIRTARGSSCRTGGTYRYGGYSGHGSYRHGSHYGSRSHISYSSRGGLHGSVKVRF